MVFTDYIIEAFAYLKQDIDQLHSAHTNVWHIIKQVTEYYRSYTSKNGRRLKLQKRIVGIQFNVSLQSATNYKTLHFQSLTWCLYQFPYI